MKLGSASYSAILDNLHDGLYLVDTKRRITYWNKAAEKISGFSATEVVGKSCADNILTHVDHEGCSLCRNMCPLAHSITDDHPREAEIYLHHKDGHRVPVSVRVNALKDDLGNIIGGVEIFTDISNQRASEQRVKELEKMAMLDKLTQLANRNYIEKELKNCFQEKNRFEVSFGILFIDIDHSATILATGFLNLLLKPLSNHPGPLTSMAAGAARSSLASSATSKKKIFSISAINSACSWRIPTSPMVKRNYTSPSPWAQPWSPMKTPWTA